MSRVETRLKSRVLIGLDGSISTLAAIDSSASSSVLNGVPAPMAAPMAATAAISSPLSTDSPTVASKHSAANSRLSTQSQANTVNLTANSFKIDNKVPSNTIETIGYYNNINNKLHITSKKSQLMDQSSIDPSQSLSLSKSIHQSSSQSLSKSIHQSSSPNKVTRFIKDYLTILVILFPFFVSYVWQVKKQLFDGIFLLVTISLILFLYYKAMINLLKIDLVHDLVINVQHFCFNWQLYLNSCINYLLPFKCGTPPKPVEQPQLSQHQTQPGSLPTSRSNSRQAPRLNDGANSTPDNLQKSKVIPSNLDSNNTNIEFSSQDFLIQDKENYRYPDLDLDSNHSHHKFDSISTTSSIFSPADSINSSIFSNPDSDYFKLKQFKLIKKSMISPFPLNLNDSSDEPILGTFDPKVNSSNNYFANPLQERDINSINKKPNLKLFHEDETDMIYELQNNKPGKHGSFSPHLNKSLSNNKSLYDPSLFKNISIQPSSKKMPPLSSKNSVTRNLPKVDKVLRFAQNVSVYNSQGFSNNSNELENSPNSYSKLTKSSLKSFDNLNTMSKPPLKSFTSSNDIPRSSLWKFSNNLNTIPKPCLKQSNNHSNIPRSSKTLDPKKYNPSSLNDEFILFNSKNFNCQSCLSSPTTICNMDLDGEKSRVISPQEPSIIEITQDFYYQITTILKNYESIKLLSQICGQFKQGYISIKLIPQFMLSMIFNFMASILPDFIIKIVLFNYICFQLIVTLLKLPFVIIWRLTYKISAIFLNLIFILPFVMAYKIVIKLMN